MGYADTVHRQQNMKAYPQLTVTCIVIYTPVNLPSLTCSLVIQTKKSSSGLSHLDYLIPSSLLIGLVLFDTALLVIRTDKLNNPSFFRMV